jgi:hypothetical protein
LPWISCSSCCSFSLGIDIVFVVVVVCGFRLCSGTSLGSRYPQSITCHELEEGHQA